MKLKIINNANSERIILELTAQTDREKLLENKLRELIAEYNRGENCSEDVPLCSKTDENNSSPNKTEANVTRLIGYRSGEIRPILICDISCFTIEDSKLIAHTRSGKYKLKERLWEIEGLVGEDFIKINQSCLVCIRNVLKFDTSIGGSLKVVLDTGYEDYVSRRQMKTVKTRILGNIK